MDRLRFLMVPCLAVVGMVPLMGIQQCGGDDDDDEMPPFEPGMSLSVADATVNGTAEFQWVGISVGTAGDMDGDGAPELLVGAFDANNGGSASVFKAPISGYVDLQDADASFDGEYLFSDAGTSIGHAGGCDVNGDGYDDLLIGSPYADINDVAYIPVTSGDNRGKAYLVFGGSTLPDSMELDSAEACFHGENDNDAAGVTVACLGDLDADGLDDIAVSSTYSDRNGTQSGAVYLMYGRQNWPFITQLGNADAIFVGETAYDYAGNQVARAGDVNGDGAADFLISAHSNDAGGTDAGKVYMFTGGRARWSGVVNLTSATATFVGSEGLRAGWSIGSAGDFDGDGRSDLLIGTFGVMSGATVAGSAYQFFGRADFRGEFRLSEADVTYVGEAMGDNAGISVGGAGDVNGDGFGDVLIGASNAPGSAAQSGKAYLIYGRAGRGATTYPLELSDASFLGETAKNWAGEALTGVGDLDQDGMADIAISARAHSDGIEQSGTVYVFYGRPMAP